MTTLVNLTRIDRNQLQFPVLGYPGELALFTGGQAVSWEKADEKSTMARRFNGEMAQLARETAKHLSEVLDQGAAFEEQELSFSPFASNSNSKCSNARLLRMLEIVLRAFWSADLKTPSWRAAC